MTAEQLEEFREAVAERNVKCVAVPVEEYDQLVEDAEKWHSLPAKIKAMQERIIEIRTMKHTMSAKAERAKL